MRRWLPSLVAFALAGCSHPSSSSPTPVSPPSPSPAVHATVAATQVLASGGTTVVRATGPRFLLYARPGPGARRTSVLSATNDWAQPLWLPAVSGVGGRGPGWDDGVPRAAAAPTERVDRLGSRGPGRDPRAARADRRGPLGASAAARRGWPRVRGPVGRGRGAVHTDRAGALLRVGARSDRRSHRPLRGVRARALGFLERDHRVGRRRPDADPRPRRPRRPRARRLARVRPRVQPADASPHRRAARDP